MEGTPFGRYRMVELLGQGGMGEVWRAYDTGTDRLIALKVLPASLADDQVFQERFRREAKAAAALDEPHVVPIHDFGEIDGRLFVSMRLVKGGDLQTLLADGPLLPSRAVWIVEQVASALHSAHEVGLVHRDVKPSNILVTPDDFAYLIDFGIARAVNETGLTSTGSVIGTWAYMSPERMNSGHTDARSDIYALTCVLHEALTGQQPFPGDSVEQQVVGHLTAPPPRPSELQPAVPRSLDDVIARGMAKDPDARYDSAKGMSRAARAALTAPIQRPNPPPAKPVSQPAAAKPQKRSPAAQPARPDRVPSQPKLRSKWSDLKVGSRVEVIDPGDHYFGFVGRVITTCDDDDDDFDVIVAFEGESDSYAYVLDELKPAAPAKLPGKKWAASAPTPGANDFWLDVGIDPIRIITNAGDYLTLRCYLNDEPIFLGYNGRIEVFGSERGLREYLARHPTNDMSSLDTYDAVRIAATDGTLRVGKVTEENVYALRGLSDDIADAIDRDQLELAVELLRDVGEYVQNAIVDDCLRPGQPLGDLVDSVLESKRSPKRVRSQANALFQWEKLERFLESRLHVDGRARN